MERTSEKRASIADQGMAPVSALPEGWKKGSSNAVPISLAKEPQMVSKIPKNKVVDTKKPKHSCQLTFFSTRRDLLHGP